MTILNFIILIYSISKVPELYYRKNEYIILFYYNFVVLSLGVYISAIFFIEVAHNINQ